jgi:hypothetical protein
MSRLAPGITAALLAVACCVARPTAAGAQPNQRTIRVGNLNVLVVGVGSLSSDHPNFKDDIFPNIAYQHRAWRREMRRVPVWIRGAMNYVSEDRRLHNSYTVWQESDTGPFPEDVLEHTSDTTFRLELLLDLVSRSQMAVYAGGGFALHYVTFSSDGVVSQIPVFTTNESNMAPSVAGGVRFFTPHQPFTAYAEFRYVATYGKTDAVPSPQRPWLTDQSFEFTHSDGWSFEGGVGFHW